jgi:hypothetical protein
MTKKKRTEAQILSAEGTAVTLGGREYIITPKRGRMHTRKIRLKLGELLDELTGIGELVSSATASGSIEVSGSQVEALLPLVTKLLGPYMDDLLDIVYDYVPTIAADREYLEGSERDGEGATDEEFLGALKVVAEITYGPLLKLAGQTMATQPQT